jgi:GT2 family glycosyltransferase
MLETVTAIVVAHDSAAKLPACLAALQREGVRAIVVDNASEDESATVAETHGARVIRNAKNQGFGRAMNIGMRAAATEFALLVNPDLVLDDGAVTHLLEAAAHSPDAVIFAPRIVEPDGRIFFANQSFLAKTLRNEKGALWTPEGDCCTPFLSGACWLVRRETVLGLGGFDESIFLFYEDDDLCRRVSDAGYALIYVHDAVARHERGASASPRKGRVFKARRHLAWSRAYVARKWGLPRPELAILGQNLPKLLLSALLFQSARVERYGGTTQGALDSLRGRRATAMEGLE